MLLSTIELLLTLCYPAYKTFHSLIIHNDNTHNDTSSYTQSQINQQHKYILYWLTYSPVLIINNLPLVNHKALNQYKTYILFKILYSIYLLHYHTNGSVVLYNKLSPYIIQYQPTIEHTINNIKQNTYTKMIELIKYIIQAFKVNLLNILMKSHSTMLNVTNRTRTSLGKSPITRFDTLNNVIQRLEYNTQQHNNNSSSSIVEVG